MRVDREKFFALYRTSFGKLTQKQVNGLNSFLDAMEKFDLSLREAAYICATTYHETAHTFLPLEEYGKGKGKKYGQAVNGKKYYGRGYVQLTWDYNYARATKELMMQRPDIVQSVQKRTGERFDLVEFPTQAMDVEVAAAVLVLGSQQGWFTGKKLSDYINANKSDFINARRVINGTDRAKLIANYAQKFKEIISQSEPVAPPVVVEEAVKNDISDPKVSNFTKVGTAVTGLTGLGINLGTMVETQVNQLTPAQVLYLCLSLAIVIGAIWWYRQSANNAHKERLSKGETQP
jgi:putative chitinase